MRSALAIVVLLLVSTAASGTDSIDSGPSLFVEHARLELEMHIDLDALCRHSDRSKCRDVSAWLVFENEDGTKRRLRISVRARGGWRLKTRNCIVPPMFVLFGNDTAGTPFAGQQMLPLTTHCMPDRSYRQYVLREYLAYRIYALLTEKSVRTRLARIAYRSDPEGRMPLRHYAFFSEHFASMAERNGAELLNRDRLQLDSTDPVELAVMELFQYMIGHTDWSALKLHNVVLIQQRGQGIDGGMSVVPFDFDFSGLVSAEYAGPPPEVSIRSTRQRLYRGFCHSGIDWQVVYGRFQDIRQDVMRLVEETPGLTHSSRRNTKKFLLDFYRILDSPEDRKQKIEQACRQPK